MGMTEDDKRNCCLLEIQETEAKYYKTFEDIEKVRAEPSFPPSVDPTLTVLGWSLLLELADVRRQDGGTHMENGRGGGSTKPRLTSTDVQPVGAKPSIPFSDCCRLEPGLKPSCCVPPIVG